MGDNWVDKLRTKKVNRQPEDDLIQEAIEECLKNNGPMDKNELSQKLFWKDKLRFKLGLMNYPPDPEWLERKIMANGVFYQDDSGRWHLQG